jgi:hypothetical protein
VLYSVYLFPSLRPFIMIIFSLSDVLAHSNLELVCGATYGLCVLKERSTMKFQHWFSTETTFCKLKVSAGGSIYTYIYIYIYIYIQSTDEMLVLVSQESTVPVLHLLTTFCMCFTALQQQHCRRRSIEGAPGGGSYCTVVCRPERSKKPNNRCWMCGLARFDFSLILP